MTDIAYCKVKISGATQTNFFSEDAVSILF